LAIELDARAALCALGAECGPEEKGGKPNDQYGGDDRSAFHVRMRERRRNDVSVNEKSPLSVQSVFSRARKLTMQKLASAR